MTKVNKKLKYEILKDKFIYWCGSKIFRIRALRNFANVSKGDLGGYVEFENNLSHNGDCWLYDEAKVLSEARVYGSAIIFDKAVIFASLSDVITVQEGKIRCKKLLPLAIVKNGRP